jgi:adenylate cyclase
MTAGNPVQAWLEAEGARYTDTAKFFDVFVSELLRTGIELSRATTGIPILHPQVDSLSCLWQPGKPIFERRFRLEGGGAQQFQNSPMPIVYGGQEFRRRLETELKSGDFPILAELHAEGHTDYLALPLPFSDGSWKGVTYVTRRIGGFSEGEVALLRSTIPALARALEIQTLRRTSLTLLETYVGPVAGRRVLEGAIKRGTCENIRAVIWMCDMRAFTDLSERLSGPELVAHINEYFGVMTEAVGRHGGEVLKFIGDAMLAIFALDGLSDSSAPGRAIRAACDARALAGTCNLERARNGLPEIRYGIALHVGEVLYGNIGGADRLDFTVIGRAVNLVTRIESLCKSTGRDILLSADFAEMCGEPVELIGTFSLKGIDGHQRVYAPA